MPQISEFYGIAIYMYFTEHLPPHFHARYGEHDAEVTISTGTILRGSMPPRARRLVLEWWKGHSKELAANWELARQRQPLIPIDPLT